VRTQISVVLFSLGALMGCGIEEKINDAGEKCEDKIYEALEHVEDVCLTKDQIWELLYEVRGYGVETSPRCEEGDVR
jgi:hypothetical protein